MRRVLLALLFLLASPGARAEDPVLAEATNLAGTFMFLDSGAPGMVLVVVRAGASLIRGYGETAKGNNQAPDGKTLLRLNSITKVFATEVLVSLAAEGKLALTDPLQKFAGDAKVPSFGGRTITLLDLATHSAALPREMGQVPESANARNWPTHEDRWKWLTGYKLPWAPGTVAAYSNVGFDLLADATEVAGGASYPDLLRARVTTPLGMTDTVLVPSQEQCGRLMTGTGLGGALPCGDTRATGGSGGLYSTAEDMARWLRHNLEDTSGVLTLSHAVYRPRQSIPIAIGFDEAAPMDGLGLGWVTVAAQGIRPMLVEKSGGGAGFMSYVAFAPGRDVGVFLAVNRVDFPMFSGLTAGANKLIAALVTR